MESGAKDYEVAVGTVHEPEVVRELQSDSNYTLQRVKAVEE
jgi:hypothetical protein